MTLGLEDNSLIPRSFWLTAQVILLTHDEAGKEFLSPCPVPGNMPRQAVIYSRQDYKIATKPQQQVILLPQRSLLGCFLQDLRSQQRWDFSCPTWRTADISAVPLCRADLKERLPINSVFCVALGLSCLLPKGRYFSKWDMQTTESVFTVSLSISAEKRRMPRKKWNSINLCGAIFANKYFIWGKKYKAVIHSQK